MCLTHPLDEIDGVIQVIEVSCSHTYAKFLPNTIRRSLVEDFQIVRGQLTFSLDNRHGHRHQLSCLLRYFASNNVRNIQARPDYRSISNVWNNVADFRSDDRRFMILYPKLAHKLYVKLLPIDHGHHTDDGPCGRSVIVKRTEQVSKS